MKVIYSADVFLYAADLTDILHEQGYFGFRDAAGKYVLNMVKEAQAILPFKQKRKASLHFSRYGTDLYYISYPKSKRTTWYFFFNYYPAQDIYYVRYITNNHVAGHLL